MAASFQIREKGFMHQDIMPQIPGPEGIESELDTAKRLKKLIPSKIYDKILCNKPIEIRHVNPVDPFLPKKSPAVKMESPSACGGRGLSIGRIFTRSGKLVATVSSTGRTNKTSQLY